LKRTLLEPWTYALGGLPPSSFESTAVPFAGRNVFGGRSDAVSEPLATLEAVTAPEPRLTFLTCPGPIFSLVIVAFLICEPLIRLLAQPVPPAAANSAAADRARAAADIFELRIAPPGLWPDVRRQAVMSAEAARRRSVVSLIA
jgi:hypothetical protein